MDEKPFLLSENPCAPSRLRMHALVVQSRRHISSRHRRHRPMLSRRCSTQPGERRAAEIITRRQPQFYLVSRGSAALCGADSSHPWKLMEPRRMAGPPSGRDLNHPKGPVHQRFTASALNRVALTADGQHPGRPSRGQMFDACSRDPLEYKPNYRPAKKKCVPDIKLPARISHYQVKDN